MRRSETLNRGWLFIGPDKKEINYDFVVDRSFAYVLSYQDVPIFTGVVKKVE